MGFWRFAHKKPTSWVGFGVREARGLEGLLDADRENVGTVLAVTSDGGVELQALGNFCLGAHLHAGFLALVTEHFDVRCDAAHLTLKGHAPAVVGLIVFGVVASHVDVNGASCRVASQNANQIWAVAHTFFMHSAQGAGHVTAIFLAGGDAPFGLDGLLGRAGFAGLGITDTDFDTLNRRKSRGHIPGVDLVAVAGHPDFDVSSAFVVHVGVVNGQGATGLRGQVEQASGQSHQAGGAEWGRDFHGVILVIVMR